MKQPKLFFHLKIAAVLCIAVVLLSGLAGVVEYQQRNLVSSDEDKALARDEAEANLAPGTGYSIRSRNHDPNLNYTLAVIYFQENLTLMQSVVYNITDNIDSFIETLNREEGTGLINLSYLREHFQSDERFHFFDEYLNEMPRTREDELETLVYWLFAGLYDFQKIYLNWSYAAEGLLEVMRDLDVPLASQGDLNAAADDFEENRDNVSEAVEVFLGFSESIERSLVPYLVRPEGMADDEVTATLNLGKSKLRDIVDAIYEATSTPVAQVPDFDVLPHHQLQLAYNRAPRQGGSHTSPSPTAADLEGTPDVILSRNLEENASSLTMPQRYGWVN
ncbi:MAG: hypothetical protein KAU14_01490, partial [Thermoplasmata archaeon]|nr:hypothetical protein [Thermoplasmata archaeon]